MSTLTAAARRAREAITGPPVPRTSMAEVTFVGSGVVDLAGGAHGDLTNIPTVDGLSLTAGDLVMVEYRSGLAIVTGRIS